ncbi:hypothetical protein KCU91_g31, partial [Aureobasidium melanogenum]
MKSKTDSPLPSHSMTSFCDNACAVPVLATGEDIICRCRIVVMICLADHTAICHHTKEEIVSVQIQGFRCRVQEDGFWIETRSPQEHDELREFYGVRQDIAESEPLSVTRSTCGLSSGGFADPANPNLWKDQEFGSRTSERSFAVVCGILQTERGMTLSWTMGVVVRLVQNVLGHTDCHSSTRYFQGMKFAMLMVVASRDLNMAARMQIDIQEEVGEVARIKASHALRHFQPSQLFNMVLFSCWCVFPEQHQGCAPVLCIEGLFTQLFAFGLF